jgi:hypothetical protein
MEYGELICEGITKSDLYTKFVGFETDNLCLKKYFSDKTVRIISKKVTELLTGVHPENRPILVPDTSIYNIMDSIYQNYRPPTGDIYGRYNIPNGTTTESYVQDMIDQVIEVIVSDVRNNYETIENNSKLSIWTTVLGEFNDHQLRSVPPIKTRLKRPNPLQFNMNY